MSKEIDWSKAPEGAEFYEPPYESGVFGEFVKTVSEGSGWKWWNGSVWQCHLGMTKERRSTLIERPSKSWVGTGLPPVGTVCEVQAFHIQKGEWTEVEILAHAKHDEDDAVLVCQIENGRRADMDGVIYEPHRFRPIRTPEQIAAEAREKAIQQMMKDARPMNRREVCADLYDAGYRKTEVGK